MGRDADPEPGNPARDVLDELRSQLEQGSFESLEALQAATDRLMRQRNRAPVDDFHGLSAEQMHRVLTQPFDSPELVSFAEEIPASATAPMLTMFGAMADTLRDKGLKPTATGALTLKVVRRILELPDVTSILDLPERFVLRSERDVPLLHATRIVAQLAGCIRTYAGKLILGRDCRRILKRTGLGGIYPRLLHALTMRFNWNYLFQREEHPLIQGSFLFTLYLLDRYGSVWRPSGFYEEAFLRAFPRVVEDTPPSFYERPEDKVRWAYQNMALHDFVRLAGFAELEYTDDGPFRAAFRLRKRPLLNQALTFHV